MQDLESMTILLEEFVECPDNPDINFDLALEYERFGQLSSALTFFLRSAEYGFESAPNLAYVANLKVGLIFEQLTMRNYSASNSYLHAISYQPNRPEGYFLLSRFYQRNSNWQESYAFALMGQQYTSYRAEPTLANIEYPGTYALIFQQAVAAWWIGRKDEAKSLFEELLGKYTMESGYVQGCLNNLKLWQ